MRGTHPRIRFIFPVVLLLAAALALAGEKTDKITLWNGDRFTGEIKRLEVGRLSLETDDAGTISIEWDKVTQIISKDSFEVELADGRFYFGSLGVAADSLKTAVIEEGLTFELSRSDIVSIIPVKNGFWARTSGSMSIGANYTKASDLGQLNVAVNLAYRGRVYEGKVNLNSVATSQSDEPNTQRLDFTVGGKRRLGENWYALTDLGLQRNTELGLDMRYLLTMGVLRRLFQTSSSRLTISGGLTGNREATADFTNVTYNLEAVAGVEFEAFRYDTPKLNLNPVLNVYTNLTNWGRVRMEFQTVLSWEIIKDFTWDFTVYDSYDNQPASGSSKNDWGLVVSFGYSL